MKNVNNPQHSKAPTNHKVSGTMPNNKQRPENKDNLDSREGEEQEFKGDDVTHNKKETKAEHLKQKNK